MRLFKLTKNEKLGWLGFLLLMGCLKLMVLWYDKTGRPYEHVTPAVKQQYSRQHQVVNLPSVIDSNKLVLSNKVNSQPRAFKKGVQISKPLKAFFPDTMSVYSWSKLGIPTWLAERTVKFFAVKGRYKKPKDLLKVYGFDSAWFEVLKDSLLFLPPVRVDLNTEIQDEWLRIDGLKPWQIKTILSYRNLLGGFVQTGQLREVYGMSDTVFNKVIAQVYCSPVNKRQLKKQSLGSLSRHPYISKAQASQIIESKGETIVWDEIFPDSVKRIQVQQYYE